MLLLRPSVSIRTFYRPVRFPLVNTRSFQLPHPTWSLEDLKLTLSSSKPISDDLLQTLANRACVDLDQIGDKARLRQDLANMIHCMEYVLSVPDLPDMTDEEIFDFPRRLTATPVRKESKASEEENEEAKQVWNHLLQPKTVRYGGYGYFAIDTMKHDK